MRMLCVLACLLCRLPGQLWYAQGSSACVFFGYMRVAVCAGWGICGTGVDVHAVIKIDDIADFVTLVLDDLRRRTEPGEPSVIRFMQPPI